MRGCVVSKMSRGLSIRYKQRRNHKSIIFATYWNVTRMCAKIRMIKLGVFSMQRAFFQSHIRGLHARDAQSWHRIFNSGLAHIIGASRKLAGLLLIFTLLVPLAAQGETAGRPTTRRWKTGLILKKIRISPWTSSSSVPLFTEAGKAFSTWIWRMRRRRPAFWALPIWKRASMMKAAASSPLITGRRV